MTSELAPPRKHRRRVTLAQYIRRRNGVPAGAPGSLRNMLRRSLGAGSFAGFWRYWNPVFGYYLGRYSYAPLRRVLPGPVALVLTFVLCGAVHDLATTAVRGSPAFLFTPWFFLLGLGVVLGRAAGVDFSSRPWIARAGIQLLYLGACLAATLVAKNLLAMP